jgi:hypothetical protein
VPITPIKIVVLVIHQLAIPKAPWISFSGTLHKTSKSRLATPKPVARNH